MAATLGRLDFVNCIRFVKNILGARSGVYIWCLLKPNDGMTHGEATAPTATPQTWNENGEELS